MTKKTEETGTGAAKSYNVHECVRAVMRAMGNQGISKDSTNEGQKFNFRGIDDALNAMNAPLVGAGLIVYPTVKSIERSERATRSGGSMTNTVIRVEYRLVSVHDGSEMTVEFAGEASDAGDKGVSKALSMSFKYFFFQTFCIPVEGMDDSDATTPPASIPAGKAAKSKDTKPGKSKAKEEPAEEPEEEETEEDESEEDEDAFESFEAALAALKKVKNAKQLAEIKGKLGSYAKHKDFVKKMKPLFVAKNEEFASDASDDESEDE